VTLRAVIVDDERLARVVLKGLLAAHPDVQVVGEADSLSAAAEALAEHTPDLVFLDVQLPDGEGTALFDRMAVEARVVFVTAWDRYAVRAFELNALDYLLKPVEPERLAATLGRARAVAEPLMEVAHDGQLEAEELLCLPHRGGMRFFRVREVCHISAADDYSMVHLVDGTAILSSKALKDWAAQLPAAFLQIHRSHVVQSDRVREVVRDGSSYEVRLVGGASVPMSRRRGATLLSRLGVSAKG